MFLNTPLLSVWAQKSWSIFDVQGQLSAMDPVDKLLLVSICAVIQHILTGRN